VAALRASARSDARSLTRILTWVWGATGDPVLLRSATPGTVRDLVLLGDFLETQGLVPQALAAFRDAERVSPGDPLPAARRAALLLRRGAPGDVLAATRDAIARGADSPTLRLSLAAALAASGNREAAAGEYEKLLPDRGARGRAVEALVTSTPAGDPVRLVAREGRAPGARRSAARVALRGRPRRGAVASAVETCRSLLSDDPGQAACRYLLADLYAERGQAEAAEMTLQARLSESPEDVAALTRLARLYKAWGRHAEARARYLRVLALEPGNSEARAASGSRGTR
jgi:predicted Zn-dependent protease